MAKAEQLLNDLFTRAQTLAQANGFSADYTPFLGALQVAPCDLKPRAVSVLAFEEAVKTETVEGMVRPKSNPVQAAIRMSVTINGAALKTEKNLQPGILAQQMIADIKRCYMATRFSSSSSKFGYQSAAWQPPEGDILYVQVQFICEYVERHADI